MAKTNKPRRRMDRYFKNLQRNSYILGYNKRGSCTTKIKKWDVIRKLTKKLITDDEKAGKTPKKEPRASDPGVQLLPRQDVMLYGTIPKMEQRVYSKCKECCRVFNPRDILSHRTCSKSSHSTHPSLLKKKVKSKSGTNKKTSLNSSSTSNSNSTIVSTSSSPLVKDPIKDFVFKKPYTPPPLTTASSPMPQLKVSVTKIGLPKLTKSATTVIASTSAATSTTSSDKSDSRVSSSKVTTSVHHSPSRSPSSVHHSSKSSSSVHNPKSPSSSSSSIHHSPKSPSPLHHSQKTPTSLSVHHSPKSPSTSTHSPRSPSSVHHSPRSPSKGSSSHHGSSHHSSSSSHHSSKSSSSSKPTPMDTLPVTSSSSHYHHSSSSSSSKSSRHKKSSSSGSSKRSSSSSSSTSSSGSSSTGGSSKVVPKDYDPDLHCGVTEGSRGPCMRSITCSNHRIQLRKLVPGRSKDIHQLIAERKAAKEKDLKHTTPPCSYTSPNGEAKDLPSQNTTFVPIVGKIVSTTIESSVTTSFVPIMPRVSTHQTRQSSTSVLAKMINISETEKDPTKALTNGYISRAKNIDNTQDGVVGTVPVLIMPMSPVSVVSSVQFLKIGNNIISLESPQSAMSPPLKNSSVILPIQPNNCNNIKMYKSHPKPMVLPNFGTRRLGGAILLANPRLEGQRNELLTVLSSKRETVNNNRGISLLNHSNIPHRPNILKVKSGTKTNCKRPANDKLVTSDSKRLVPDVNGFILHADVSETADAPQSNNCIQEKIALLNMK